MIVFFPDIQKRAAIQHSWTVFVRAMAVCCLLSMAWAAPAYAVQREGDSRSAWQGEVAAGARTYFDLGEGKWIAFTPKGTTIIYLETERNDEYVEVRDPKEEARYRFYADHGDVRKTESSQWRRFAMGRWRNDLDIREFDRFGKTDYRVRLVYFLAKDRSPVANYQQKIAVVMQYVNGFIRNDLRAKGHETPGLQFELDENRLPRVYLLKGEHNAAIYNDSGAFQSQEHHRRIAREIDVQLGDSSRHLVIAFAETYDEDPADRVWPGHIAQAYASSPDGGNATFSAWMLRDEFCALTVAEQKRLFFDSTPVRGRTAIGHRGPNSPRSEFVEDAFGGLIHEVGHALGLPHDHREAELYIMGSGFRNLRRNLQSSATVRNKAKFSDENAQLLMCSRYLSSDVQRLDYTAPQVELQLSAAAGTVTATVSASDDTSLRCVAFVDQNHRDRSLVAYRQLTGDHAEIQEQLPQSVLATGSATIKALVFDAGGNMTEVTQQIR